MHVKTLNYSKQKNKTAILTLNALAVLPFLVYGNALHHKSRGGLWGDVIRGAEQRDD